MISFYIYYLVPNEGIYYYVPFDGYITLSHLKSLLLSRQMKAGHLAVIATIPHVASQSFITNLSTIADYRQSIDFISLRLSKFAILLTK